MPKWDVVEVECASSLGPLQRLHAFIAGRKHTFCGLPVGDRWIHRGVEWLGMSWWDDADIRFLPNGCKTCVSLVDKYYPGMATCEFCLGAICWDGTDGWLGYRNGTATCPTAYVTAYTHQPQTSLKRKKD